MRLVARANCLAGGTGEWLAAGLRPAPQTVIACSHQLRHCRVPKNTAPWTLTMIDAAARKLRDSWTFVIVLVLGFGIWAYVDPNLGRQCEYDDAHTVEDLMTKAPSGSRVVPRGFAIEQGHLKWSASNGYAVYAYPAQNAQVERVRGSFSSGAQCRVQDPSGEWWLVVGGGRCGRHSCNHYIPERSVASSRYR